MCSTPSVPLPAERQPMQLPDQGDSAAVIDQKAQWRQALLAGMVTGPQGLANTANVGQPTLGGGGSIG